MLLIKRYPNRKLYDTEAKRYVTLQDLASAVRAGREVEVVDQETGKDVTEATLARVVLLQARQRASDLSRSLLTHVIRAASAEAIGWRQRLAQAVDRLEDEGEISAAAAAELRELGAAVLPVDETGPGLLESRVQAVVRRLSLPSRQDLDELSADLDGLVLRLQSIDQRLDRDSGTP